MFAAAVTGTNGKTSTAEFGRQLLARRFSRVVSVGSLGNTDARGRRATPFFLSRPGCWATYLQELALEYDAATLEAFSAGLATGEWDGVDVDAAVLTSFGHEHLDVHGSPEAYAEAKLRLLRTGLRSGGSVIVSRTCELWPEAARIARERGASRITYGPGGEVRIRGLARGRDARGTRARIEAFGVVREVELPLTAHFLVENALAALCLAVVAGVALEDALDALGELAPPPGRMELAATVRGAEVFVDFAHNPEALKAALCWATGHARGRVVLVFGCGGDRDPWKRPRMGAIASRYGNRIVVTDDNPRTEDPASVRAAVLAECPEAEEVPDRVAAIRRAIEIAAAGDVVLICGRGAEETQDLGGTRRDLSDVAVARAAAGESARNGGG